MGGATTTVSLGHDYAGFVPQSQGMMAANASTSGPHGNHNATTNSAGTTNLINININNAGTITSVASGETHHIPIPAAQHQQHAIENTAGGGGGIHSLGAANTNNTNSMGGCGNNTSAYK